MKVRKFISSFQNIQKYKSYRKATANHRGYPQHKAIYSQRDAQILPELPWIITATHSAELGDSQENTEKPLNSLLPSADALTLRRIRKFLSKNIQYRAQDTLKTAETNQ